MARGKSPGKAGQAKKKAAPSREPANLRRQLAAKDRELARSLEQQAASAEILRAIASSPGELNRVLDIIADTAQRLFDADRSTITRIEGNVFREVAAGRASGRFMVDQLSGTPVDRGSVSGRAAADRCVVHVPDVLAVPDLYPQASGEMRTVVAAPLLREGEAIGTIAVAREEVKPFSDREVALLQSFADQAVIAIENARLLGELRESLDHQTANADVLDTIARAPGDAEQVLQAIVRTAHRLLRGSGATISRIRDGTARRVAASGLAAQVPGLVGERLDRGTPLGRAVFDRRAIHVPDILKEADEFPADPAVLGRAPMRTILATPLMREGEAIGAIAVLRAEVQPFTDKEIQLLETFADQAVIAIENARLLAELRESLDNQTASAEILRTIAASPAEAGRALDTIARIAANLFGASSVMIRRLDGDVLRYAAAIGPSAERVMDMIPEGPLDPRSVPGATILEKRQINIPDMDRLGPPMSDWPGTQQARAAGTRASAATPLLRQGEAIGAIVVHRSEPKPFTERELAQLSNFADQAVIAIENARLLAELNARMRELSESLDQQTATSEILRAIASAPGEAESVLQTIANTAHRLSVKQQLRERSGRRSRTRGGGS